MGFRVRATHVAACAGNLHAAVAAKLYWGSVQPWPGLCRGKELLQTAGDAGTALLWTGSWEHGLTLTGLIGTTCLIPESVTHLTEAVTHLTESVTHPPESVTHLPEQARSCTPAGSALTRSTAAAPVRSTRPTSSRGSARACTCTQTTSPTSSFWTSADCFPRTGAQVHGTGRQCLL